jgi:hypothetical protein
MILLLRFVASFIAGLTGLHRNPRETAAKRSCKSSRNWVATFRGNRFSACTSRLRVQSPGQTGQHDAGEGREKGSGSTPLTKTSALALAMDARVASDNSFPLPAHQIRMWLSSSRRGIYSGTGGKTPPS